MSSSDPSAPYPEDGGDGGCPEVPLCEVIRSATPTLISISKTSAPSIVIDERPRPPKLFFPTQSVCNSPTDDVSGQVDDSDSEDDEEEEYKRSAGAMYNRVTLGILAVSLLWLSSLSTAVYITGYFVRLPRTSKVFSICQATSWALAQQARAFRACSERQLNTCGKDLDLAASAEQARVDVATRRNSKLISEAEVRYSTSAAALLGTQNSLSQWQRHHVIPYNKENATCPVENRTEARTLLGDVSASRTQILAATSLYARNGQDLVFQLVNYTVDFRTYNDDYLANKTATVRSVMSQGTAMINDANATYAKLIMQSRDVMSCLSSEPRGTCKLIGDTARREVGSVVTTLQDTIDTAQGTLQTLQEDIVEYTGNVNTAFNNMKRFYEAAVEAFTTLNLDPSMLGSAWSLGLTDFYADPPLWPDVTELLVDPVTKSVDTIWQKVKEPVSALVGNLSAAQQRLERDAVEMREHLTTTLLDAVVPDDYQPPIYPEDPREQLARFRLESENFMAQTGVSILDLSEQAQTSAEDKAEATKSNVTGTASSLKGLDFNFNIKYETVEGLDVDIPSLFDVFGSITDVTIVCDYLYRAYSSLRLMRKFWNQSALELPTVDLRPATLLKGFFSFGDCVLTLFSPNGFFARLLASGRLPYILLAAALIPIGIYLSVIYFLVYNDYRQGCVTHQHSEGSLLSRTVTSLGFNYAAMAGNQRMYDGLRTFHQSRVKMCAERSQSSNTKQLNAERYMASLADGYADSSHKIHLLRSCLNTTALDSAFNDACCNQTEAAVTYNVDFEPYMYPKCGPSASGATNNSDCPFNKDYTPPRPYPPPSVGLSQAAWFVNETALGEGGFTWTLEDGRFDCGRLPSCPATCVGPNRELVKLWSRHCSCSAEWLLHSYVLHTLLSLLVYAVLNASRWLLIGGLVRMRWRQYVSNPRLAFTAFVDTRGRPEMLPEDMRHVASKADKHRLLSLSPPQSPRHNILHRHAPDGLLRPNHYPSPPPASPSDIDVTFPTPQTGGGGASSLSVEEKRSVGSGKGREEVNDFKPSAPPLSPLSAGSSASVQSRPMSAYEERARREQAFLHGRTLDTIREYERWGRARAVLGVVLNGLCFGTLTAVPSALEYAP